MRTLAAASEAVRGVGLHGGAAVAARLLPARRSDGVYFVRTDLRGPEARVAAEPARVVSTRLSTALRSTCGTATVATVEHLLAALLGAGVRACRVELDAPELPLLDGSAAPWLRAIQRAGLVPLDADAEAAGCAGARLRAPVRVADEDSGAWAVAMPASRARLTVGIDFPHHPPIGRQWASWSPEEQGGDGGDGSGLSPSFAEQVAPARTFALEEQIEPLRAAGLIKGGDLDSALVCSRSGWLNGPLRFDNEPSRHKLLDLMGDLALLGDGALPRAHIVAFKAGHSLHVRLAHAISEARVSAS